MKEIKQLADELVDEHTKGLMEYLPDVLWEEAAIVSALITVKKQIEVIPEGYNDDIGRELKSSRIKAYKILEELEGRL